MNVEPLNLKFIEVWGGKEIPPHASYGFMITRIAQLKGLVSCHLLSEVIHSRFWVHGSKVVILGIILIDINQLAIYNPEP
jgi:hypothetical protein